MIFNNYHLASEAACAMIEALLKEVGRQGKESYRIALSGGSTVGILYDTWVNRYKDLTPWERFRFYWVDERCVPVTSPESNYGIAKRLLLEPAGVDTSHIHPIIGSNPPAEEAVRYSGLVKSEVPLENGVPVFDMVFLGIGPDGHTSSVFPGQEELLMATEPYVVSVNPQGQKRIAMTGKPMIKATHTWFFVTGKDKKEIMHKVTDEKTGERYPAGYVMRNARAAEIFSAYAR